MPNRMSVSVGSGSLLKSWTFGGLGDVVPKLVPLTVVVFGVIRPCDSIDSLAAFSLAFFAGEMKSTWNSCTCFCCSACNLPIVLKNSPTVDSTRSLRASPIAFPKKKASRIVLLSFSPGPGLPGLTLLQHLSVNLRDRRFMEGRRWRGDVRGAI
nr:hypothetical protein Iba_chr08bCG8080 [Ipomoea batatas]